MAQALTAADRTPEPGDVLIRALTGSKWSVVSVGKDYLNIKSKATGVLKGTIANDYWDGLEYISRADGGPVTKEGE